MYISELYKRGCVIVYLEDHAAKRPYWGMSTMEREILLFNVRSDRRPDWPIIEDMLQQADEQYRTVELGQGNISPSCSQTPHYTNEMLEIGKGIGISKRNWSMNGSAREAKQLVA